jgi:CheY-like chemotaxis protein
MHERVPTGTQVGEALPLQEPRRSLVPADSTVILVVERDQNVRELQAHFLQKAGFAAEFVDDGLTAFERAVALRPAIVVTEILVPKLDGLTLCRRLREDPATRGIPVVVFSILAAAARAREAGANAFLRKPLVESTFIATVRDAVAAPVPPHMEQQ